MRTVPLFASARAVFEARADRRWMPHVWLQNAEEWVFPNWIGGPIEPSNWSRREWRPALEAAGIEDLHFHDLRHFAASALRDAGMDNKMRSVVIGHADERITDGVYTPARSKWRRRRKTLTRLRVWVLKWKPPPEDPSSTL